MSDQTVVVVGVVLPGPTLAPPYAVDERCVLWVAAPDSADDATGGGLPFQLRADDGRELLIECAGASARLPVRVRISFDSLLPEVVRTVKQAVSGRKPPPITGTRLVSWVAVGDRIQLRGLQYDNSPFRGVQTVQAVALQAEGEPSLRAPVLEAAEPEG